MEAFERLASADLRIVTYDQRGTGGSTAPNTDHWGFEAQSADLDAVIAAVHAGRVHLVGHSFGGLLAMAYTAAHPERVASLVAVASAPPTRAALQAGLERYKARLQAAVDDGFVPKDLPAGKDADDCGPSERALMPSYWADPARYAPTPELGTLQCSERANQATWKAAGNFDLVAALRAFKGRSLIVFGAGDPVGIQWADATAAALPRAERAILPACGHFPWLECGEAFWPVIAKYFQHK
jgi:proline iminopeptidase